MPKYTSATQQRLTIARNLFTLERFANGKVLAAGSRQAAEYLGWAMTPLMQVASDILPAPIAHPCRGDDLILRRAVLANAVPEPLYPSELRTASCQPDPIANPCFRILLPTDREVAKVAFSTILGHDGCFVSDGVSYNISVYPLPGLDAGPDEPVAGQLCVAYDGARTPPLTYDGHGKLVTKFIPSQAIMEDAAHILVEGLASLMIIPEHKNVGRWPDA